MASPETNGYITDGNGSLDIQTQHAQGDQQQQQQQEQQEQQTQNDSTATEPEGCGCGTCQPKCLQRLAKPIVYLISVCFLVFTQSFLVAGYSNSILTSIEKRYNLRSSEAGLIAGSYDMTSILALIVVSYLGDSYNRCKWMGSGAVVMAIGTTIFIFPHFLGGTYKGNAYNASASLDSLCNVSAQSVMKDVVVSPLKLDCSVQNPETWALAIFIIAQLTIGIGTAPIFTLGPTYLYDNVKSTSYSVYAGIMYSMAALGPALGFLAGGFFLSLHVDFNTSPSDMTIEDEHWVGAWWMGFIVCTGLSLLTAFPLLLFPKKLPCTKIKKDEVAKPGFFENIKEFPGQMWKLLKNPTWLGISFTFVCEQSISTGFVTFMAKYMQVNFAFTASRANIITGLAVIPAAFMGIILGGVAMKHLKLSLQGITKFMLLLNVVPTLGVLSLLFMGCSNVDMAGVTTHYSKFDSLAVNLHFVPNLTSTCNSQCGCSSAHYDPVCGGDSKTYYSPCHAGCAARTPYINPSGKKDMNYTSCSCIADDLQGPTLEQASSGRCGNVCHMMVPFILVIFVVVLFTSLGHNPLLLITLRCVDPRSRSFSLGMQTVLFKLLASIPAPIYFGRIFDSTCLVSAHSCDDSGACLLYDVQKIPYLLFGTVLGLKFLTFLFIVLTYLSLRCSRKGTYEVEEEGTDGDGVGLKNMGKVTEPTVSVIATYLKQTT